MGKMARLNVTQSCGSSESVGLRGRLLRKIEALKAEQSGSEAPDEFLCPITRELIKDPVIAAGWFKLREIKKITCHQSLP